MRRQLFFLLGTSAFATCLGIATCATGQSAAAAKHPFTPEDWASLRSAHAVAVEAASGSILYKVTFGGDQGPTQTEWWMVDRKGTGQHKLDLPKDFAPAGFTRQGDDLYGSYRIGDLQQFAVFRLRDISSGAVPSVVVMLPRGVDSVTPSPDGSRYALLYDPRPPDPLAQLRNVIEPGRTAVYIVRSDGTGGTQWCEDLKQVSQVAWSSDGASLAVLSTTPNIGFHYVHSRIDLCVGPSSHLLAEIPNITGGIAWTGNGREIAFLGTTNHVLTTDHVWTVPVAGGAPVDRTPNLQASAMALEGDPSGEIWVAVQRGVRGEVDRFANGALTTAYSWSAGNVEGPPVFSPYIGSAGTLAFTVGDPDHAANVAVAEDGELRKVSAEADRQLEAIAMGEVRVVHWTSREGIPLEGIATFPAGYVQGKKYPFLVLPHGGPEANDRLVFDPFSRMIAGLGYVVLQPEYRGSTGYGTEFLEAIYQHFGDRAYRDVDSATDYAIAQGWADPNRLAIFGWSAGGFMTAWTVTQTNRYRAAIEGAGITDWGVFMWTSDIQQIDYDARWPEEDPEAFRRFSAVDFADRVATPLLILHGAADRRVPTYQGQEFFEILAARGKTVRMVTYPGSPHFPDQWQQRLNVMHEVADWLARYNP